MINHSVIKESYYLLIFQDTKTISYGTKLNYYLKHMGIWVTPSVKIRTINFSFK